MPLSEEEQQDFFKPNDTTSPNGDASDDEYESPGAFFDYGAIFDAPDFASIVRGRRSAKAKQYEIKVKSVLKSGTMASLRNGQLHDAATILRYGPGFAAASGDLADVNEFSARAIDLITSPESPYVAFFLVGLPFIAQLFRNHEDTLRQIPEVRKQAKRRRREETAANGDTPPGRNVTMSLPFGRKLSFRVGFRFRLFNRVKGLFRVPTQDPAVLTEQVFSDERLIAALKRQGINIVQM